MIREVEPQIQKQTNRSSAASLLCVLDHPTQYDGPLWRQLAARGRVNPIVWYRHLKPPPDPEQNRVVQWGSDDQLNVRQFEIKQLLSDIRELHPRPAAILTSGWRDPSTWRCVVAARRLGSRVILPSDSIFEFACSPPRAFVRTAIHLLKNRLVDGFFTTGILGLEYLQALGVPSTCVATGLYPVDADYWQTKAALLKADSEALRNKIGADAFIVLSVCKLHEREDPLHIVEAFTHFRKIHPRAHLLMVGDGPLRSTIEHRLTKLGNKEHVSLIGHVPYTHLAMYYGAANVFVHAPRSEPWGISVSEAMSCGVPVVATWNVGAGVELISEGKTGAWARPSDTDSLVEALVRVAHWSSSAPTDCLSRVRQTVDVDRVAAKLEQLVEQLTHHRFARPALLNSIPSAYHGFRGTEAIRDHAKCALSLTNGIVASSSVEHSVSSSCRGAEKL